MRLRLDDRSRLRHARCARSRPSRSSPRRCTRRVRFWCRRKCASESSAPSSAIAECVGKKKLARVSSSQRKSARRSRVGRMADHEKTSPMLTRMPSLAEWQMRAAGDVAAVLAVAREKTEKVAGDLTAAADAPFAGGAENEETVEASAEPAAPPVVATVPRMPSLGAWAMSDYMAAAEREEEELPTTSREGEGNAEDGEARVGEVPETRVGEAAKAATDPLFITSELPGEDAMRNASPRVMRRPRRPTTRQGRNANPQKRKRRASSRRRQRRNAPRKSPPPRLEQRRRRAGRHARGVNHLVKHDTRRGHAHRRQHISISSMHHVNSYA